MTTRKRAIKSEVYSVKREEDHNEYVKKAKIDVRYRTNSLNEAKRIYIHLKGNAKGFTKFAEGLKERCPDAKLITNDVVAWHFNGQDMWEYFNEDEYFKKVLKAMRIDNIEELNHRVMLRN